MSLLNGGPSMKNKSFLLLTLIFFLICSIQVFAKGAGIVPFYRHTNGDVSFLLGEDHHRRGVWTDFGGKADKGESFSDAAAREGHEETMGVFSGTSKDPKKNQSQGVEFFKKRIKKQLQVQSSKNDYKTYFVDVTDAVEVIKKEAITRKFPFNSNLDAVIKKLKGTRDKIGKKKDKKWGHYKEKIDFKWVTFEELQNQTVKIYHWFTASLKNSGFGEATYHLTKKDFNPLALPKINQPQSNNNNNNNNHNNVYSNFNNNFSYLFQNQFIQPFYVPNIVPNNNNNMNNIQDIGKLDLSSVKNQKFTQGTIFTALRASLKMQQALKNIQDQLAKKLNGNFSPTPLENLHVTLQEFHSNDATENIIAYNIDPALKESLQGCKQFSMTGLQKGTLSIKKNGLVMLKFKSSSLNKLATTIKTNLDKASLHKYRHDAPDKFHITLGYIKNNKTIDNKLIKLDVIKNITFDVSEIVLLKSNKPEVIRKYYTVGSYKLFGLEQNNVIENNNNKKRPNNASDNNENKKYKNDILEFNNNQNKDNQKKPIIISLLDDNNEISKIDALFEEKKELEERLDLIKIELSFQDLDQSYKQQLETSFQETVHNLELIRKKIQKKLG